MSDILGLFLILIFVGCFMVIAYDFGRHAEWDIHYKLCLCDKCKKWREDKRKEGKEPEAEK